MGQRGRPPKPTALKLLEGDRGHGRRPINENEPKPKSDNVKCPAWLNKEAKKEWKRLSGKMVELGILTDNDITAFAGYCVSYAKWKEAEKFLEENGMTITTPSGYIQQRPEVAIAAQSLKMVQSFCSEFGLTPASRTRINAGKNETNEDDPMAVILAGKF